MPSTPRIRWLEEPEEKDYLAAHSFLSMVIAPSALSETIAALRTAPLGHWAAKDLLRAAGLPPLKAKQSAEVAEKLKKIKNGIPISPVLLIGGIRDLSGHRRRVSPRIGRLPRRRGRTGARQVALDQLSAPAEHLSTAELDHKRTTRRHPCARRMVSRALRS